MLMPLDRVSLSASRGDDLIFVIIPTGNMLASQKDQWPVTRYGTSATSTGSQGQRGIDRRRSCVKSRALC